MEMQHRTRTRTLASPSPTAPPSPSWVRVVKQLDFYYKPDAEAGLLKRSKWGGAMTLVCSLFLTYLVLSEIVEYVSVSTVDVLTVDTRRGVLLPIFMDIYFPSLPCIDVGVDVVEASSGETLEEAAHQIIKQRTSPSGAALDEEVQLELGLPRAKSKDSDNACPSCLPRDPPRALLRFGRGRIDKNACCHTCEQVRSYLEAHHLPQAMAEHTPQCRIEKEVSDDEGCRVHGYLEVPRGKGDFHVAAGAGVAQHHEAHQHHMHQVDWARIHKFNITHIINSLSFGPAIPNYVNPLDGHKIIAHVLAQHMYMIQVVPTQYESSGKSLYTNQFSYTQHHQKVQTGGGSFALPGVYFKYEINPLMIKINDKNSSFANFLTRICAIVGGLYVVFGIVYSLTAKAVTTTKRRSIN